MTINAPPLDPHCVCGHRDTGHRGDGSCYFCACTHFTRRPHPDAPRGTVGSRQSGKTASLAQFMAIVGGKHAAFDGAMMAEIAKAVENSLPRPLIVSNPPYRSEVNGDFAVHYDPTEVKMTIDGDEVPIGPEDALVLLDEVKAAFNKHMADPIESTREQLIADNKKLRARVAELERALLLRMCEDKVLTTTLDDEEETDGKETKRDESLDQFAGLRPDLDREGRARG